MDLNLGLELFVACAQLHLEIIDWLQHTCITTTVPAAFITLYVGTTINRDEDEVAKLTAVVGRLWDCLHSTNVLCRSVACFFLGGISTGSAVWRTGWLSACGPSDVLCCSCNSGGITPGWRGIKVPTGRGNGGGIISGPSGTTVPDCSRSWFISGPGGITVGGCSGSGTISCPAGTTCLGGSGHGITSGPGGITVGGCRESGFISGPGGTTCLVRSGSRGGGKRWPGDANSAWYIRCGGRDTGIEFGKCCGGVRVNLWSAGTASPDSVRRARCKSSNSSGVNILPDTNGHVSTASILRLLGLLPGRKGDAYLPGREGDVYNLTSPRCFRLPLLLRSRLTLRCWSAT